MQEKKTSHEQEGSNTITAFFNKDPKERAKTRARERQPGVKAGSALTLTLLSSYQAQATAATYNFMNANKIYSFNVDYRDSREVAAEFFQQVKIDIMAGRCGEVVPSSLVPINKATIWDDYVCAISSELQQAAGEAINDFGRCLVNTITDPLAAGYNNRCDEAENNALIVFGIVFGSLMGAIILIFLLVGAIIGITSCISNRRQNQYNTIPSPSDSNTGILSKLPDLRGLKTKIFGGAQSDADNDNEEGLPASLRL